MRASKSAANRLLNQASRAVFLFSAQRQLLYANAAGEQWLGSTLADLGGRVACYGSVAGATVDTPAPSAHTTELGATTEPGTTREPGTATEPSAVPASSTLDSIDISLAGNASIPTDLFQQRLDSICPPPECFCGHDGQFPVRLPQPNGSRQSNTEDDCRDRWAVAIALDPGTNENEHAVLVLLDSRLPVLHSLKKIDSNREQPHHEFQHEVRRQLAELDAFWAEHGDLMFLGGTSPAAELARDRFQLASQCQANVLVCGPAGVGRNLLCRILFRTRHADDHQLATIDCRNMYPEPLQRRLKQIWSTAADTPTTLMLMNVDQLPPEAQVELLGWLQLTHTPLPILSTAESAAQPTCLLPQLRSFLTTVEIELPALDDRPEDVPVLAQAFLEQSNRDAKVQLSGFAADAWEAIGLYRWPGQTHELQAHVQEAAQRCREQSTATVIATQVTAEHLPAIIRLALAAESTAPAEAPNLNLDQQLQELEDRLIEQALDQTAGNRAKAAEILGISRSRLVRRLSTEGPDFVEVSE